MQAIVAYLRHYPGIFLDILRKTTKASVRIADLGAEISTRNLLIRKHEC
jgi:hypothetical protein